MLVLTGNVMKALAVTNSDLNEINSKIDETKEFVNFDIKPNKIFIFNKETENRIYLEGQAPTYIPKENIENETDAVYETETVEEKNEASEE